MSHPRRPLSLLAIACLIVAACGTPPVVTPPPASGGPAPSASATPPATDMPFVRTAWPTTGSACGGTGSAGGARAALGRVEAVDPRTVVFTLCAPDGAFLARLAHPSMGIVNAADLARVAADPSGLRDLAGQGAYRVVQWGDDNVQLARVGPATPAAAAPTVILRWSADPATRTQDVVQASVDGIDAPTPAGLDAAATTPSLTAVPRVLLATTVLGFGQGTAFADARIRRAISGGIDRGGLADALAAGTSAADHIPPCQVPNGCAGGAFRAFNAPSAVATMQGLNFNFDTPYTLTIPDSPIPGLPDPAGTAAALAAQLAGNLGLNTRITVVPAAQFRSAVDGGTVSGLYLDGVATTLADPSAFYGPVFVDHPSSLAASRAGSAVGDLQKAAAQADPTVRAAAYAAAATKLRDSVPVAPLVHPGAETVFLTDVKGAATSPLGEDPLGAMTAGDRGQVVFEQAASPGSGWCGAEPSLDAYRLCGLVTDGLYGYAAGSLSPVPRLAASCTANGDATVWTCRLRPPAAAPSLSLDAADVVATIRAMADPADPVHQALGDAAFAAWAQLFQTPSPAAPGSSPGTSASPPASPAGSASATSKPQPSASASGGSSGKPSPAAGSAGPTGAAGG